MCSAAAFGNVFTFPTQDINPADLKQCIKDYRLISTQIEKKFLFWGSFAGFPSSADASDFHPTFWDLRGSSAYRPQFI